MRIRQDTPAIRRIGIAAAFFLRRSLAALSAGLARIGAVFSREGLTALRVVVTELVLILAALGVGALLVSEILTPSVRITVVSVPEDLAKRGFTEKAATEMVRTELERLQSEALTLMDRPEPFWEERRQNFAIPGTSFGIVDAATYVKRALGRDDPEITAYILGESQSLRIAIRSTWSRVPLTVDSLAVKDEFEAVQEITKQIARATQPYILAAYYHERKEFDKCRDLIEEMHEHLPFKDPERTWAYLLSGLIQSVEGDHKGAVEYYNIAIKRDDRFALAHNNLGNEYYRLDALPMAIEAYTKAIEIDGEYVEAYLNRGHALFVVGRIEDAIADFKTVAALDPNRDYTYIGLGNALLKLGSIEEAKEAFQDGIDVNPNVAEAHLGLGTALFRSGDFEGAVVAYRRAFETDPALKPAYVRLARDLRRSGEARESSIVYLAIRGADRP